MPMRRPPTPYEIDAAIIRLSGLLGQDHPYIEQRRQKDKKVAAALNELGKLLAQEDRYVERERQRERRQAVIETH